MPDVTVPNTLLHTLLSPPLAGVAHLNRQHAPSPWVSGVLTPKSAKGYISGCGG